MTARQRSLLEQHQGLADATAATESEMEPKESEEKETGWDGLGAFEYFWHRPSGKLT